MRFCLPDGWDGLCTNLRCGRGKCGYCTELTVLQFGVGIFSTWFWLVWSRMMIILIVFTLVAWCTQCVYCCCSEHMHWCEDAYCLFSFPKSSIMVIWWCVQRFEMLVSLNDDWPLCLGPLVLCWLCWLCSMLTIWVSLWLWCLNCICMVVASKFCIAVPEDLVFVVAADVVLQEISRFSLTIPLWTIQPLCI